MNKQKNISPYLGVPGIQMINARYLRVDMLHLKIAEKDLAEGRPSVTPNQPVSVEYNINDKSFRLTDGYHRYLEKRGGSVEAALLQSRQGVFPDYAVNVTLVKTLNRAPFGDFTEALTREEEQTYLEQIYGIENRLHRASEQGFDIHTTWYHGSVPAYGVESADFDAFDKSCIGRNYSQDQDGFFFINDASIASIYATSNSIGRSVTGGCVYPVYLACSKVFQVDDRIATKKGWGKPSADGVIAVWDNHHHEIKQTASLFGADSIELIDITRGQRMMVAFEPTQIRSIHSSFLPEHRGRTQLLGHDISFPPPPPKPPKPIPEHLIGIISEIENIIQNEPQWNGPGATKLLLKSVGGADWSKDDKLSFFHALHERTIQALPYKERAVHVALLAEEIISTRKSETPDLSPSHLKPAFR